LKKSFALSKKLLRKVRKESHIEGIKKSWVRVLPGHVNKNHNLWALPMDEVKKMKQFCFKIKDSTLEGVFSMNKYAKSTTRFTRIVTSVVISLTLFVSSVPMSTYAAIQAPP
jgi:hypothetical protein